MSCDDCPNYVKVDETWVPYQETWVKYSDDYGCALGHDLDCCPDEAPVLDDRHHTVRSYNRRDEEQDEWGDWAGHIAREDGR